MGPLQGTCGATTKDTEQPLEVFWPTLKTFGAAMTGPAWVNRLVKKCGRHTPKNGYICFNMFRVLYFTQRLLGHGRLLDREEVLLFREMVALCSS